MVRPEEHREHRGRDQQQRERAAEHDALPAIGQRGIAEAGLARALANRRVNTGAPIAKAAMAATTTAIQENVHLHLLFFW